MKLKRLSIGYRTLKTAVGVILAISLAQLLHLEFFVSAGILTILCIQPTKKRSIRAALSRFIASLIAIGYASVFLEGIAYHPVVVGLMILLFIPVLVSLRFADGFVSSSVIIFHIYSAGNLTGSLILNEILLMVVGFGTALLVNMYMPSIEKKLDDYRYQIELLYAKILHEMAVYLKDGKSDWDGKELMETEELLGKAKALAYQDVENHVTRLENKYYRYFDMRQDQFEIIERILPKISTLPVLVKHAQLIADFLNDLADHVHAGNTAYHYLDKLEVVKKEFSLLPLPKSHKEFQSMAALYQVIEELDSYLEIKQSYRGFTNKKTAEE
ncbi:aromatic acid exporter family protein [Planomicrobium sp. Y74]|uniref:aromatic acid exporter family protein n=1 Tax=Planomicrobium sp. Y74 TaxID=2478977 RepID=UPI000EF5409F|nr:aromatic acid exporter family protein [Planomicrobium sp. Y74]RLQ92161.1 aromatic acid exporter family protein [Planomicrobium sp. Y74]